MALVGEADTDESRRLNPQLQTALKQLLMGASITEAAQASRVTR